MTSSNRQTSLPKRPRSIMPTTLAVIAAGALALPAELWADNTDKPNTRVVRIEEGKKLGENHKGRLTSNNKSFKDSGRGRYAEGSFSHSETARKRSEDLRARHAAAFGNAKAEHAAEVTKARQKESAAVRGAKPSTTNRTAAVSQPRTTRR